MMQMFMQKTVHMPLRHLWFIGLTLAFLLTVYLYFQIIDQKISALVGGVSGGLAVYLIQFVCSLYEYKQIDKFRGLGIVDILPNRRDEESYRRIVKNATHIVQVMGTSCTRFIDDFANSRNRDHLLLDALNKNQALKVQFLVPTDEHMDLRSKGRFDADAAQILNLLKTFGDRIEMRRFEFQARHSMVRVDESLIVGPVFQEIESRDSPAVHVNTNSVFAEKYITHFEWVWSGGSPLK
jgi:hypothetical protein